MYILQQSGDVVINNTMIGSTIVEKPMAAAITQKIIHSLKAGHKHTMAHLLFFESI
jgi:hypothetical protein